MSIIKHLIYLTIIFTSIVCSADSTIETVNDFSRLNPIEVRNIVDIRSTQDILDVVNFARANRLTISISGKRNSQGGHTAKAGGLVLNMNNYNKVARFSPDSKTIVVESGITWREVQAYINHYGLALKVAQSANIFSVGGSISSNIHGRDPRYGTIVETIISFKIILSDGRELKVSRSENSELFYSAIGGYGLLGVITEVELSLIDNHWLKKTVTELPYSEYTNHLTNALNEDLALHYGRCSIARNEGFFENCISVDYIKQDGLAVDVRIEPEKNTTRDKFFFGLSREYTWGKSLRWWLQDMLIDSPGEEIKIPRNNAMSPPISFIKHYSEKNTDILQEYFIPKESLGDYLSEMKEILLRYDVNVLSMTLRFVPKSEDVYLNYAETDSISVVLYMNIAIGNDGIALAKEWTKELVDLTARFKGKYYLTYQRFPTEAQFREAYPRWQEFNQVKKVYDKYDLFTSEFYSQYFSSE